MRLRQTPTLPQRDERRSAPARRYPTRRWSGTCPRLRPPAQPSSASDNLLDQPAGPSRAPELVEGALARRLVRPPAPKGRAVPEPVARNLIVAHFRDQRMSERFPLACALCRPAARATRRTAGEARRAFEFLEFLRECRPFGVWNRRRKTDVMKFALPVEEPEQKRTDEMALLAVAKSA